MTGFATIVVATAGCGSGDENEVGERGQGASTNDQPRPRVPASERRGAGSPQRVVQRGGVRLVPLDRSSRRLVAAASRVLERRYGVQTSLLPRLHSDARHLSTERGQLDAGKVVGDLQSAYPKRARRAVVIGVTDMDVFWSRRPYWRFVFGVVGDDGYAVLSTARMDPRNLGRLPDATRLRRRLTKMVTRYVGELYFRLPRSDNPRSVLFRSILGGDDLDAMTDAFCPARPTEVKSC